MKLGIIKCTIVGLSIVTLCATAQTAEAQPCTGPDACGPGWEWVMTCPDGTDDMPSKAVVGIYQMPDCSDPPNNFVLRGDVQVVRAPPTPLPPDFQMTILAEITNMSLTGGGATVIAGAGLGQGGVLQASLGEIRQQAGDQTLADSYYDVFFEFDGGAGPVYNQVPLKVAATIDCVPPEADYIHPQGQCIALYDSVGPGGNIVAYLGDAVHTTFPPGPPIPTVSEWGLIVLTLSGITVGTIVLGRRRRMKAVR